MKTSGRYIVMGCGAMGCAFADVLARAGSDVLMGVLPFDEKIYQHCAIEKNPHPALGVQLHEQMVWKKEQNLTQEDIRDRDILIAVNSEGIDWSLAWLEKWNGLARGVLYATKGLPAFSADLSAFLCFRDKNNAPLAFGVLAGPCLAGDLAKGVPSSILVASHDKNLSARTADHFSEAVHVSVEISSDPVGVAWCSALKNLYAIGVSATEGMWGEKAGNAARNVQAGFFMKSLREMEHIVTHMNLDGKTVWGLAGLGDLYVTVGGGRNGRFGKLLGQGHHPKAVEEAEMKGITIEGLNLARSLYPTLVQMADQGKISWDDLPLIKALLDSLVGGKMLRLF